MVGRQLINIHENKVLIAEYPMVCSKGMYTVGSDDVLEVYIVKGRSIYSLSNLALEADKVLIKTKLLNVAV